MPPVRLPQSIVDGWASAVIKTGRWPRGKPKPENKPALLKAHIHHQQMRMGELWEAFTCERERLTKTLLNDKAMAHAYLTAFHLSSAARCQLLLDRIAPFRDQQAKNRQDREWIIHDIGCGTGAMAQVAHHFFSQEGRAYVHAYDQAGSLLDLVRVVMAGHGDSLSTHRRRIEDLDPDRFALNAHGHAGGHDDSHADSGASRVNCFILGYVFNEISSQRRARDQLRRILKGALQREEPTLLFIIEPATQGPCRRVMEWRDQLVAWGYRPLYPCPATAIGPCPMLSRARDWCFSEGSWEPPPIAKAIDRVLQVDRSRLRMTSLLLASPQASDLIAPRNTEIIVGRPATETGYRYLLCAGDSLRTERGKAKPRDRGLPWEPHPSSKT